MRYHVCWEWRALISSCIADFHSGTLLVALHDFDSNITDVDSTIAYKIGYVDSNITDLFCIGCKFIDMGRTIMSCLCWKSGSIRIGDYIEELIYMVKLGDCKMIVLFVGFRIDSEALDASVCKEY